MTIIDDVGEGVTLREVTRTIDKYGDESESTSDSSVTCVIEILGADEDIVKSGILNTGDAIGYFKPTETKIKTGNRIQHGTLWYVIDSVDPTYGIGGTAIHIEAHLKRLAPQ